jgi:hypothetical protein
MMVRCNGRQIGRPQNSSIKHPLIMPVRMPLSFVKVSNFEYGHVTRNTATKQ